MTATLAATEVVAALRDHTATVSTAESLTAGMLCATLVDVPGASEVVRGGIVAYSADLKAELLGVPEDLLARVGTVDAETAAAMATGGRRRLGSSFAVATTGVAGPDPVEGKPVGLVFVAVAGPGGCDTRRLRVRGDRAAVRAGAVRGALDLLLDALR